MMSTEMEALHWLMWSDSIQHFMNSKHKHFFLVFISDMASQTDGHDLFISCSIPRTCKDVFSVKTCSWNCERVSEIVNSYSAYS
jgi:hypothetical protein